MDPTRLAPEPAGGDKKQQAIRDAKDMASHTLRTCDKLKIPVPPYEFLELIGKGGTGRVYKCRDRSTGNLVAVKIVDTDIVDYEGHVLDRDSTIRDFQKEVATLQKLKEGKAQNINIIHDAMEIGSNLWIVSDYCTGGSVRTLMRALPPGQLGLEEQYIIPIARELLIAMVGLHSLGIIHRDIKCTNVYITETGALQLGDYGVVGVTDDQTNKRKTVIGTPHWMPRELLDVVDGNQARVGYGTEIDIWSFGCTVYEMATGMPPNARVPMAGLNRALLQTPKLEGEEFSQQLRDFVGFCLNIDPMQRPTAEAVLDHPYVANTERKYPTSKLVKLIEKYKLWEYGGGVRQSLWMAGGAADIPSQPETEVVEDEETDDWNFSTSDTFNTDFERRYSHMIGLGTQAMDLQFGTLASSGLSSTAARDLPPIDTSNDGLSNFERLQAEWSEQSANRGEQSLARLYRLSAAEYKLHTPMTEADKKADDLPLRSSTQDTEAQESVVDLDEADYDPSAPFNFDFVDATTLKARKSQRMSTQDDDEDNYEYGRTEDNNDKRATMEWTFPSTSRRAASPKRATMDWTFASARPAEPEEPELRMDLPPIGDGRASSAVRPTLKHTQTMPLGDAGDYIHPASSLRPATSPIRDSMTSMIDLDMGMGDPSEIERPGTAISTTDSHFSDMTSGNPFDLEEDPEQLEADRKRFSHRKQWQSEGGQADTHNRRSIPMHTRGSSLSSTDNEPFRNGHSNGRMMFELQPRTHRKNGSIIVEDNIDLDSWPNFDQPGIERVSSQDPDIVHAPHQSGVAMPASSPFGPREIEFPEIVGPSAAALAEDAPTEVVAAELNRMIDGLSEALLATARVFEDNIAREEEEERREEEARRRAEARMSGAARSWTDDGAEL